MNLRQPAGSAPTAQPRERAVLCGGCLHRFTLAADGRCDHCKGGHQ